MTRFETDFRSVFCDRTFTPRSKEDLKQIAKARADVHEGKPVSSTNLIYLETYSIERSYKIIAGEA